MADTIENCYWTSISAVVKMGDYVYNVLGDA